MPTENDKECPRVVEAGEGKYKFLTKGLWRGCKMSKGRKIRENDILRGI